MFKIILYTHATRNDMSYFVFYAIDLRSPPLVYLNVVITTEKNRYYINLFGTSETFDSKLSQYNSELYIFLGYGIVPLIII